MDDNDGPLSAERPKINLPQEHTTVDYENPNEKDDSEYQVLWSKTMEKGSYKTSSSYKDVYVLLLRWAEGCDDLEVDGEVSKLKSTFENCFNYHAEIKHLDAKSRRRHQVQVNAIVAAFIGEHDDANVLLIVYYAGHGKPGKYPGDLALLGLVEWNQDTLLC